MSKTIRRKANKHQSVSRVFLTNSGFKTAGRYTTWDTYTNTGNGHEGYINYREMTDLEKYQENRRLFGESKHGNAMGPGRLFKRRVNRSVRALDRREIHKELRSSDYDGVYLRTRKHYRVSTEYW